MSFSDTQCLFKNSSSCGDFKGKSLPSLNEYWGKHCALITKMDKLYFLEPKWDNSDPTLPLPYPVLPYYPTNILPYPIPALPIPYPIPYLTLPNPSPYYTLPYLTIPYPSLPHSKLSNPTIRCVVSLSKKHLLPNSTGNTQE